MNLLLVDRREESYRFAPDDGRVESILRLADGKICIGVINGPRGVGSFRPDQGGGVLIEEVRWELGEAKPSAVDLIVGLPRPAEARRIIVQASAMGVRRLSFALLDRTPSGYAGSRSLSGESMDRLIREGLEQGFHTTWPEVCLGKGLEESLNSADPALPVSLLDPYLGECLLGEGRGEPDFPGTVFLGSERGFSPREQEIIRLSGARLRHLGSPILRTETAVVTALALAHRQTGYSLSAARSVIRVD